jgi:hypothetical protein
MAYSGYSAALAGGRMSHELHSENARLVMVQTLARMFRFTCEQVWSVRASLRIPRCCHAHIALSQQAVT